MTAVWTFEIIIMLVLALLIFVYLVVHAVISIRRGYFWKWW